MARQGWEPSTPLSVLYDVWSDKELGEIDLTEFVLTNSERVEALREASSLHLRESMSKRKVKWDRQAKVRKFEIGDEVLTRKPGLCGKLEDSWEGPFTVCAVNSPLSYGVNRGDRKIPSVHVSLMKRFEGETEVEQKTVKRTTTVMDEDKEGDEIQDRYSEVKVLEGDGLDRKQRSQRDELLQKHKETLTKDPGLTTITEFKIDTGDNPPVHQRPYSTPAHFRASIDVELDWLSEKGYIRPSSSPWASPIVAVRKPDGSARLCVDYKRLNTVTKDVPFYMPRVEEVLEGVGQARFISKMDLTKGYYQVRVAPGDIAKTSFICHRGQFEFLRMPFGVKNAPAYFQVVMQGLFEQHKNCAAYMDDLIIYSDTWDEHLVHIDEALNILKKAGLTVNPTKCVWGGRRIEFLGHEVGGGKMALPAHIQ